MPKTLTEKLIDGTITEVDYIISFIDNRIATLMIQMNQGQDVEAYQSAIDELKIVRSYANKDYSISVKDYWNHKLVNTNEI